MDEREAYDLFAPARERTLPQPRISLAEVYAADARRRKRNRRLAVVGSVTTVVVAVVGTTAALSSGTRSAQRLGGDPQTSTASSTPPTFATSAPKALSSAVDALQPPAGSQATAAHPEIAALYSTQPGYQQVARAWTTSLAPAAAYAEIKGLPPESMSGGITSSTGPGKGPAETSGTYTAAATSSLIGPRLDVDATANSDGTTTITAVVWSIDQSAKPVTDFVRGSVSSVTATYTQVGGIPTTGTVDGLAARRLADGLNGLLVATGIHLESCSAHPPTLHLVLHTSVGDQVFEDRCGEVWPVPGDGHPPLVTSDALNLEVNHDFGSLMPTPPPSSAPLGNAPAEPSFAPTPGIGTLDIAITVVGGPAPGVNDTAAAGTITVSKDGQQVAQKKVTQGQRWSVHLPAGSYEVQASMGGACQPVTVKAESAGVTPVVARCDIR